MNLQIPCIRAGYQNKLLRVVSQTDYIGLCSSFKPEIYFIAWPNHQEAYLFPMKVPTKVRMLNVAAKELLWLSSPSNISLFATVRHCDFLLRCFQRLKLPSKQLSCHGNLLSYSLSNLWRTRKFSRFLALSDWIILANAITQPSHNAKNNFVRVSQVLLYIIKRQIYFELEVRCLQLQKKVGK